MRLFNLEEAKQGEQVITRDGRPVRIICFDRHKEDYPIVALIEDNDKTERIYEYTELGEYYKDVLDHDYDLMMADEGDLDKKTVLSEPEEQAEKRWDVE